MMNKETIYSQWKVHRRQIPVPGEFAAGVMASIRDQEPLKEHEFYTRLIGIHNRFRRWSVAAVLVLLGLFRLFYIAASLLRANPLVPY